MTATRRRTTAAALLALVGFVMMAPGAALAERKIVRLVLDGPMLESPRDDLDLVVLFGQEPPRTLRETVELIQDAAADSSISGMALIIDQPQLNLAQIEELSQALQDFRKRGKKIFCYMDFADNASYALATAANHITLAENSDLWIPGLLAQVPYYKEMLDKIGVQAAMLHCGAYKSALEPYTRTGPSDEARENMDWLLDGLYNRWISLIAEQRGLTEAQVTNAVDQAPLPANDALEHKLIDAVASFPAFKQQIRKEYGNDVNILENYHQKKLFDIEPNMNNPFAMFDFFNKLMNASSGESEDGVALIYVDGGIILGESQADSFGGGMTAGSTTIRAALERARSLPHIKAVVLRVDSPGGSATASDIIWKAAERLKAEKPLIVSMGRVAGSGGYYVALPGDRIYADATTITGSIGVVGGKLVWKELMNDKLGIHYTQYARGKNADLWSANENWTDAERSEVQGYLDRVYAQFKSRVMASRGQKIKGDLDSLAGGRVYTGKQALERGLIDELGTLDDALRFARTKAGLAMDSKVYVLPEKEDLASLMKRIMGEESHDDWNMAQITAGGEFARALQADPLLRALLPLVREFAGPLSGQLGMLRNLAILQQEHVGCFMPFDVTIR